MTKIPGVFTMLLVSGNRRRTSAGVSFPRWFGGAHSGIITVSAEFPVDVQAAVPREVFNRRVRGSGGSGRKPQVLVLHSESAEPVRETVGPVWRTTPAHVIDVLRRGDLDLTALRTIMTRVPLEDGLAFLADVGYILSKSEGSPQIVLLVEDDLPPEAFERLPTRRWRRSDLRPHRLGQQKGSDTMAEKKDSYIADPQTLRDEVQEIIRRIHDEADPHEMNAYKRFIKKNVSIFSRSYFTAYLVREFVEGKTERRPRPAGDSGASNGTSNSKSAGRKERGGRKERAGRGDEDRKKESKNDDEQVGNVAPEDRKTLFVSVGKNRRVYPKDFVALFAELDGVEGDDIGQIKILDNYSFVEVDERVADAIIGAYDGYEFRGRKLTVNFARNKKD